MTVAGSPRTVWRVMCGEPEREGINETDIILPTWYWPLGDCRMRVLGGRVFPDSYQAAAGCPPLTDDGCSLDAAVPGSLSTAGCFIKDSR